MKPYEHGGNLRSISGDTRDLSKDWIDFSASINPLDLPPEIKYHISQHLEDIRIYPDPESVDFIHAACKHYDVKPENILIANGASEIFFLLMRILPQKKVILVVPSYSDYERAAKIENKEIIYHQLIEAENFVLDFSKLSPKLLGEEIVILGRPNNPTGTIFSKNEIIKMIESNPKTIFIIDEAFIDFFEFSENDDSLASVIFNNLITVCSLTKIYSIPGLRTGLAIGHEKWIQSAKKLQSSWPLNTFAQQMGALVLQNAEHAIYSRNYLKEEGRYLVEQFSRFSKIKIFPVTANFVLFKLPDEKKADQFYYHLIQNQILIRRCSNFYGLDHSFFRMAILLHTDNEKFISVLADFFGSKKRIVKRKKPPALMIQGTGSNVGKSLLCTALCRIFLQEGYRVMPFKAQNMSLNSCVAMRGGEISRAQHLQALAARVDSDVRMNPVLLKPVDKSLSQVILLGKASGNFAFSDYRKNKDLVWQTISSAYDDLSAEADIMILEGAGSPVEMNLKNHDVVNMRMAEYADARVILAANIDFGGIFASIAGTLMLLEKKERARITGLIVNQFRGDESLFIEGKKLLEKISGKDVLGIIPGVENLMLPDEDSLAFSKRWESGKTNLDTLLNIVVIKLPHISNFTDFDPFHLQKEISFEFIDSPSKQIPDALIIPGSKNVMADMQWLDETGLSDYIKFLGNKGCTEIIGLCGGLQMLGKTIKDPHSIESSPGSQKGEISGLALLHIITQLESEKVLKKFSGIHMESQLRVTGYEIHHGHTSGNEKPIIEAQAGFSSANGDIWGTYLHGIFDENEFRQWFINRLLKKKKINPVKIIPYNVDESIENFSQIVRDRLDMNKIKKSLNL
ncbi:MAG: cobyric acid synthase [Spirochaetia bacterium]|nr:cobyric acid synthase [Spirochaetia bacterium]